ncbi:MAG: response regulator transcription factor [Flavobacterium sp.]|nr:MAG: response regulator transcription factor [Flavobacterium sp.]
MNILIADESRLNRLQLKSYIHQIWPIAVVYEESNLDAVIADVFDQNYDLLIIDIAVPGNENIKDFITQAVKYTKVIVFSETNNDEVKIKWINDIGVDAFLWKSASKENILSILMFVLSEV